MSEQAKPIVFTRHARDRCAQRGTTETDVAESIQTGNGSRHSADCGCTGSISNFSANGPVSGTQCNRWSPLWTKKRTDLWW